MFRQLGTLKRLVNVPTKKTVSSRIGNELARRGHLLASYKVLVAILQPRESETKQSSYVIVIPSYLPS